MIDAKASSTNWFSSQSVRLLTQHPPQFIGCLKVEDHLLQLETFEVVRMGRGPVVDIEFCHVLDISFSSRELHCLCSNASVQVTDQGIFENSALPVFDFNTHSYFSLSCYISDWIAFSSSLRSRFDISKQR